MAALAELVCPQHMGSVPAQEEAALGICPRLEPKFCMLDLLVFISKSATGVNISLSPLRVF